MDGCKHRQKAGGNERSGDIAGVPERAAWIAFGESFGVWDVDYLEAVVPLAALSEWIEYRVWKSNIESGCATKNHDGDSVVELSLEQAAAMLKASTGA